MPLQQLICFRKDRLTIRQQCGHVQAFEGSTSGALLVDVGHRPASLAGTPDHLALDVWHGLGVVVAPRLGLPLPKSQTAHLLYCMYCRTNCDCTPTGLCLPALLARNVLCCTVVVKLYVLYCTIQYCTVL